VLRASSNIQDVGLGLRTCHYQDIIETKPNIPWFEAQADNYLGNRGLPLYHLTKIRESYPVSLHGVGMSLGSTDKLNLEYVKKLKQLIDIIKPELVSEHLCWCSVENKRVPDLLPLPYTQEVANFVADKISQLQDILGRKILIENVSSYLTYKESVLHEWEFLKQVVTKSGCDILLDINNIYVSSYNHNFEAEVYLDYIAKHLNTRVKEFHLAGFTDNGKYLIDTHSNTIHIKVLELYKKALKQFGKVPTLIEWDNNIPEFEQMHKQQSMVQNIFNNTKQNGFLTQNTA